jgi:carbon-monoxide dehydrogenase medium subunit
MPVEDHDEACAAMKPAQFEHHAPERLDEVLGLLAEWGDEGKVLAGGQSLVPILALRLARFDHLVDVNRVESLRGVTSDDDSVRVGAMTRHRVLERDPTIAAAVPGLADATRQVGHFQIRTRGTLGGAIAHADPAAEQPAVALALDAVMEVEAAHGRREIPAREFFEGTWTTALAPDELLVAVRFPVWAGPSGFAVEEVSRRSGDFALVGVVCGVTLDEERVVRAGIALFGVGPTPVRASNAETALIAGVDLDDVVGAVMTDIEPSDDLHATAQYRRTVAQVLVRRAVGRAMEEARGG